jgi:hypothetical protein
MAGIRDRPRPLDLAGRPQPVEQQPVQPLPDARLLPLIEAPPAVNWAADALADRAPKNWRR